MGRSLHLSWMGQWALGGRAVFHFHHIGEERWDFGAESLAFRM